MGGPAGLGTQSLGMLEAVNLTLLGSRAVFPDRLPLDRSEEPPVWATVAWPDPAPEPCPAAASVGTADDSHRGDVTVVATITSAATPTRAFFRTRQTRFNPLFFSLAGFLAPSPLLASACFRRALSFPLVTNVLCPAWFGSKPGREAPPGSSPTRWRLLVARDRPVQPPEKPGMLSAPRWSIPGAAVVQLLVRSGLVTG